MTPLEAFRLWAPPSAPWSAWAKPVLFTQLPPFAGHATPGARTVPEVTGYPAPDERLALLLEMPGLRSVELGIALGQAGYQPVPLFNAACGLFRAPLLGERNHLEAVPMLALRDHLAAYAADAGALRIAPNAPPAFLLDAGRMGSGKPPAPGHFDNRSYLLPQDFPSARMLREAGLHGALVAGHLHAPVAEDLQHVLRRWQEDGLRIEYCVASEPKRRTAVEIPRPPRFRRAWHTALALFGLRANSAGGFGDVIPLPSQGHG